MKLYDYQAKAVENTVSMLTGQRSLLLYGPTGSGKTVIGAAVVARLGGRALWLAHRRELVNKARELNASETADFNTIQSELRRPARAGVTLIVVDEAHHSAADSYKRILARYPDAKILGLSATPVRGDGQPLLSEHGGFYEGYVEAASLTQLVSEGRILLPRHFTSPERVDTSKFKKRGSEFDLQDAGAKLSTTVLCGNIVEHYIQHGSGRRALVAACTVEHARQIARQFNQRLGPETARVVTGEEPVSRQRNVADFILGRYPVCVQVNVLTEGWDFPGLGVVILARPTRSLGLYHQIAGRVMRTSPGKETPVLLDHGGVFHLHGSLADPIDWHTGIVKHASKECPRCHLVCSASELTCPCGHNFLKEREEAAELDRAYMETDEELVAVDGATHRARSKRRKRERDLAWAPINERSRSRDEAIYSAWLAGGVSHAALARKFDCARQTVLRVCNMQTRARIDQQAKAGHAKLNSTTEGKEALKAKALKWRQQNPEAYAKQKERNRARYSARRKTGRTSRPKRSSS